ncbi:MAG: hypothetical protein ACI8RZ_001248 [Myxococcota bacterium]|jgi:hypothetical protein
MSAVLLSLSAAFAHKPSFSTGQHSSPESAFWVADPEVSIVLYHEVTCETPQLWMQLWLDPALPLYVQLGVPVIDRLSDHRPSMAILGPGLPEIDVPFEIPDGLGGILIETDAVAESDEFYEPFSKTESWVLHEETLTLPEAGLGYIVAWDPTDTTGKLWVAVGTREDFTSDDLDSMADWLDQTQAYHESGDYEGTGPAEEQECATAAVGEDAGEGKAAGCAVVSGTGRVGALLVTLGLLGLRRRSR